MSLTLTGTGKIFNTLGAIFARIRDDNVDAGTGDISAGGLKSIGVGYAAIRTQFDASTVPEMANDLYSIRDSARSVRGQTKSELVRKASETLINMVHLDATLTSKDLGTAIAELIRQMLGSGTLAAPDNDVDASTVSASVSAVSTNTGTGVVVASVLRPDGRPNELVLPEVMEVIITDDFGTGATARQEPASFNGEVAIDPLDFNWPGGSAGRGSLTAIDASQDASGNLLYNSDFDSATSNVFDYWGAALSGVAGTDILEEASTVFRAGGKALRFKGTAGTPASAIAQAFNQTSVSTGTSGTTFPLKPNTLYAYNCWMRISASLVAGAVKIDLFDGSSTINNDFGTANSKTTLYSALSSSAWTAVNGFFLTPKTINSASTVKFRLSVSTALTNGESVYIDDLAVCEVPSPAYTGGPWLAMFAGDTKFIKGDQFHVTIANNVAGDFQTYFDRCFNMKALGLQLPSDTGGTESVADSLLA